MVPALRTLRGFAADIEPLKESAHFRRLFTGQAVSRIGSQVTAVAVPLQVYAITHSSLDVGLVGVAGLVPLISVGIYAGAIIDAMDRRKLLLITSTVMTVVSASLLVQALAHTGSVALLYALVVIQAAASAVDSPTRFALIPQLVRVPKLPAANTLDYTGTQAAILCGPLIAGVAVAAGGYGTAYAVDLVSFAGAFYAAARLPALRPGPTSAGASPRAVLEGFRFLAARRVVMMTFIYDVNAMLFASPRALFPALAYVRYGGGAATAGLLYAAPAVGAIAAAALGGAIARVHHHGLGIILSIVSWATAITFFGLVHKLWLALFLLALAGAADAISTVYRSTMLQTATPPSMQGRMQSVYNIVVTGGPRLGDVRAGAVADTFGIQTSIVSGGLACLLGTVILAALVPAFWRYDTRTVMDPAPAVQRSR